MQERDALALHNRLLALDGGAGGVRDRGLLLSALARPQQVHAYGEQSDIGDLAAAYIVGLLRNHPFVDGNKRTGFIVGVLFLEINAHIFTASEESATGVILDLAAGIMKESAFKKWLRENSKRRRT
jgi:death on curing protein